MLEPIVHRALMIAILACVTCVGGGPASAQGTESGVTGDHIKIGDHIRIEVRGHPELSKRWITVERNGNFVLVNARLLRVPGVSFIEPPIVVVVVKAAGLSMIDFVEQLERGLTPYVSNPVLTVTLGQAGERPPLQPTRDELPQQPSPELGKGSCDSKKAPLQHCTA